VTRNYSEKVINKVLDMVSGSQNMELLQARATAPPDAAHPAGAPCRLACRVRLQALRVRLGHGHPSSPGRVNIW